MQKELILPVSRITERLRAELGGRVGGIWLYGSAVYGDFRPGWSDLDFLCLTDAPLSDEEAENLLLLRQTMQSEGDPFSRLFEGAILSSDEYRSGRIKKAVYWGTSGQRITDSLQRDVFAEAQLAECAVCLAGRNAAFPPPSRRDLIEGIQRHLLTIRQYARVTGESLYSCGWLLDIARGLYTLETGKISSKTAAGEWAKAGSLCPDPDDLEKTLQIRREPLAYRDRAEIRRWLASLGPSVQRFADVLEARLDSADLTEP